MTRVLTVLVVLLIAGVATQSFFLANQSAEIKALNGEVFHKVPADSHGEEHEDESHMLVHTMGSLQLYFGKAWFAGEAENWELAHFYVHEMEEFMEGIVEGEVIHDGKNISQLMKDMSWAQLEALEASTESKDKLVFESAYTTMVNSCNSCHAVTKHPFIKIKKPTRPAFDNQIFELTP